MIKKIVCFFILLVIVVPISIFANKKILNIYNWSSYMPAGVLVLFTKETGIKINYSTFDSNEQLYTKIKANPNIDYDIVVPSSYFVGRMAKEGMLQKLDKSQLPNLKYIERNLLNRAYDPGNVYSIPYLWGTTSLIINTKVYSLSSVTSWSQLWDPKFLGQISMEDDVRDVFAIAFLHLGYSINDENPVHIKQAFEALKKLLPNVLTFTADGSQQMYVNEDANIGLSNSGDALSVISENPSFRFTYPKEGPIVWIDNLVIPRGAKHIDNAYKFMNFIMRPGIAKMISIGVGYASPNRAAKALMPESIRNNIILYPPANVLKKAQVESAVSDKTNALYLKYWERLKLGG